MKFLLPRTFPRTLLCAAFSAAFFTMTAPAQTPAAAPAASGQLETAVFASGCFWCTEAVFERVPGVRRVVSGYTGGHVARPTYEQVTRGDTGHAEATRIEFDPAIVSYAKLLEVFFEAHDPTSLNRQGADEGPQYRSAIFYASEAQRQAAVAGKQTAQARWDDPIVTEIAPLGEFYAAEGYHQDYFKNNPHAGYCSFVIKPKVKKLQQKGVIAPERTAP